MQVGIPTVLRKSSADPLTDLLQLGWNPQIQAPGGNARALLCAEHFQCSPYITVCKELPRKPWVLSLCRHWSGTGLSGVSRTEGAVQGDQIHS